MEGCFIGAAPSSRERSSLASYAWGLWRARRTGKMVGALKPLIEAAHPHADLVHEMMEKTLGLL